MKKRIEMIGSEFFKELKDQEPNLRSAAYLFELFLKSYPKMRLDWEEDWKDWTKKILTFFGELGKFCNFQIYLRPDIGVLNLENEETSEYLVDLCWSPRQVEEAVVLASWIELALESELSAHDIDSIIEDFWKLTDVKAYMKVGIFSPLLRDRKKVLDMLSSAVAYHSINVPTERYLIILIIDHGQKEMESQRIEVEGYEIDYLGELKKLGSRRFPLKPL